MLKNFHRRSVLKKAFIDFPKANTSSRARSVVATNRAVEEVNHRIPMTTVMRILNKLGVSTCRIKYGLTQ